MIAGILGFIAMVAVLVIHQVSQPSWWLLLGVVPGIIGALIVFG